MSWVQHDFLFFYWLFLSLIVTIHASTFKVSCKKYKKEVNQSCTSHSLDFCKTRKMSIKFTYKGLSEGQNAIGVGCPSTVLDINSMRLRKYEQLLLSANYCGRLTPPIHRNDWSTADWQIFYTTAGSRYQRPNIKGNCCLIFTLGSVWSVVIMFW